MTDLNAIDNKDIPLRNNMTESLLLKDQITF